MKKINNFNIDTSDMSAAQAQRLIVINGETDAEFSLQIFNSSNQFYNFNTRVFESGSNSNNVLKVRMKSSTFNANVLFPASGSGTTYTLLLLAPPDKDVELDFGYSKKSFSVNIVQNANTQLTFTVATANTNNYTSWSSGDNIVSIGAPSSTISTTKTLDWTLTNASNDTYGFGLRLIRQPINTDWYYTTTETVDGAVSSSTEIIVDDLTDLATGMYITGISGGSSLSGTPTVRAIDTSTKTLTMSSAQTFVDNTVLTFQARGSSVIKKAIGADIDFSNWNADITSATSAELTKVVRATASDQNIALVGTYGISGGGFVTMSGVGIKNTDVNTVRVITADDHLGSNGSISTLEDQDIKIGTKIYFRGSTQSIDIDNAFTIKSYPSANKIIYLNLDNFITPGVSGE